MKNVLVIAAPGAAGVLTEATPAFRTAIAFVCFCLAASATYFINDAIDVEADRMHPTKRTARSPPAKFAVNSAIAGGIVLAVAAVLLSFAARWQLPLIVAGYLALTFAYSRLAQARAGARPRGGRVRVRAARDRGRHRGRRRRSRRGS